MSHTWPDVLSTLVAGSDLTTEQARWAMDGGFAGAACGKPLGQCSGRARLARPITRAATTVRQVADGPAPRAVESRPLIMVNPV